ncbi:MAG: DNA-binding response regulator [Haliscomenobacteraceae bacterium CHB4]|nr:Transcriptional regulatory protein CusR [Saprospiraceae bacterium]MCE7924505.1 DNA-binding response regulator [Haliscomenobacteraceae bacterium CHB4]
MTSVLLIEDEPKVAAPVKKWLEENDFAVELAPDGAVGRHLAQINKYDIVLLDLNLPFISGYDVCRAIRAAHPQLPIIMVTALGSVEQKLTGFDAGADDYIVKPFDFRELLARMRTLLKRNPAAAVEEEPGEVLRVADMEINTGFKTVTRGGNPISLTAREYSLLEYLVRRNGRVASRNEIVEHVWDVNFDTGTNVVEVYINFLRKKIDKNYHPKLIHTKQGMGYYLKVLPV